MSTDVAVPTDSTNPTDDATQPFIKVMHDRDTGRTIIALDAAATDALDSYLDGFKSSDYLNDYCGWDDPNMIALTDAISRLKDMLSKHLRRY